MKTDVLKAYPILAVILGMAAGVVLSLIVQMAGPPMVQVVRGRLQRGKYNQQAMQPAGGQASKAPPIEWPDMLTTTIETRTHYPRSTT